jgi:uncharacterized membrane protein
LSLVGIVTAGLSLELQHGQGSHGVLLSALVIVSGIIFLYQDKLRIFVVQALMVTWSVMWVIALLVIRNIDRVGNTAMGILTVAFVAPFCVVLYYVLSDRRR